jgi:DNA-binding MltR family transcriptional regulator
MNKYKIMSAKQKLLTLDEFAEEIMAEKQPRALIILGTSQIEIQLRNLIQSFILPKKSKTNDADELLDGDTPLSTFSSRIKIAVRLGLIDVNLANQLNKLREIRNIAAHWTRFRILDSPLKDKVRDLQLLITARRSYKLTVERFYDDEELNDIQSLQAMLLTLSAIIASLENKFQNESLLKMYPPLIVN